jgi:hypothetical protein
MFMRCIKAVDNCSKLAKVLLFRFTTRRRVGTNYQTHILRIFLYTVPEVGTALLIAFHGLYFKMAQNVGAESLKRNNTR